MTTKSKTSRSNATQDQELVQNKILLDELIKVMSLLDYPLNLLERGRAAKYRFEKYGQVKEVLYQDILEIIERYPEFMRKGFFIILDERVIDRHGLQDIQSQILTKENIDKIIAGEKEGLALFKQGTPEQQETICKMIIEKIRLQPESMDMNFVDALSRLTGMKILEIAEESRELFEKKEAVV